MRALTVLLVLSLASSITNSSLIDFSTAWQECDFYNSTQRWIICPAGIVCPFLNETESEIFLEKGCMWCPENGKSCQDAVADVKQRLIDIGTDLLESDLLSVCIRSCDAAVVNETCSRDHPCTPGSSFCDYSGPDSESGICQACPLDIDDCYQDGYLSTEVGKRECVKCGLDCSSNPASALIANGLKIPSEPIHSITANTTMFYSSGELIDCSDLILHDTEICPGASDRVCIIHDYTLNTFYWEVSNKAEKNGCVAVILFGNYMNLSYDEPCVGHHSFDHLGIPFVCISYNEGKALLGNLNSKSTADVTSVSLGLLCATDTVLNRCSDKIPCHLSNEFCNFGRKVENGVYVDGWCEPCNEDPLYCYFDPHGGMPRYPEFVKSCVSTCDADVQFERCKLCPNALSGSNLMEEYDASLVNMAQCSFCPGNDVLYPNRIFGMFGSELECWQVQAFFQRIKYSEDSVNCRLAQSFNYYCGCEGNGYAGADSAKKQAALVWLPRVIAILSIMGSSFMIYDIMRVHTRRSKLLYQLLVTLSIFDIVGSIAYAFTSLPIPVEDYIYGAMGNDASCKAQGFFIQIGTIACFINSSLSSYYYLTIIRGLSEDRLKKKRLAFFLPQILIGLVFAFAGLPWYYDMLIWCNNTALYWPEIPVILSITWATIVMGALCKGVMKTERKSRRYSVHSQTQHSISAMVVEQSFLFVAAFYVTWLPYLALQYMWATGRAFTSYGFVLYAASSVPMQGLLNCFVYIKPRYLRRRSVVATNAASINTQARWRQIFSLCQRKTPGNNVDAKQRDESPDAHSELQSTSKLTKPPELELHEVISQSGGSALEQSVLNSSMLGERLSQPIDEDQLTAIENENESNDQSNLHTSVLKSSMLGESM